MEESSGSLIKNGDIATVRGVLARREEWTGPFLRQGKRVRVDGEASHAAAARHMAPEKHFNVLEAVLYHVLARGLMGGSDERQRRARAL
jgi:hypothetical protein